MRYICTGKVKFSYTQRYTVWNNCNYEGCVGGVINCCDGIQEQPVEAIDETEIEANIDTKGVVRPSFANLGNCGACLLVHLMMED